MRDDNPNIQKISDLMGKSVVNLENKNLGKLEEIMMDCYNGQIAYAVLSFGGILGMGDKLFAIPWEALEIDAEKDQFILDADKETLKEAPGFDKNDWPDMADEGWATDIYAYYNTSPYWL